jgi:hypothetical protein
LVGLVAAAGVTVEDDEDLARPALGPDGVRQQGGELGRLAGLDPQAPVHRRHRRRPRSGPQASGELTPSVIDSNGGLLVRVARGCFSEATANDEQRGSDMRAAKRDLPVTAQTRDYTGVWAELGDMHYAFETCAGGYDMDALVKIFPDHACPVEHWGYVFRGKVRVEYTDGHEEILSAGDAFYIPSGHRPYMLEETELLQLTRKSDHNELVRQFVAAGLFPAN